MLSTSPVVAAESKFEDAVSLHNAGRDGDKDSMAEAVILFEALVEAEPGNVKAIAYLGSSYAITARDSDSVVDKVRYTNRGLRRLDQAVEMAPNSFVARLIRANVTSGLPAMFFRKKSAIEDGLALDGIFTSTQSPQMAKHMIGIYEMLDEIAEEKGDWKSKADAARKLATSE